jgi:surfactin synthase thioesterase subunit
MAAKVRLFCFPYAGGGASVYRTWGDVLPPSIEVCAIQLPGRERRLAEPAFRSMAPLTAALTEALEPYLDRPFALFGHSMGATIAYEVARRCQSELRRRVCCLLVSGRSAPQISLSDPATYCLSDDDFVAEIRQLDGTPEEVLANAELMALMIPLLRADFELIETYRQLPGERLDCPVFAFGAEDDVNVSQEELAAWREITTDDRGTEPLMFHGGHFYLHSQQQALTRAIASAIFESM